jgi:hypothetical protein
MMEFAAAAQLVAAFALSGGAFYWGGQVKSMLSQLKLGHEDHEHRIRSLERPE